MRETLRDMELKITELADYLHLSRPTMYKYIDCYEAADYKNIDKAVLKLFKYIDAHKDTIGKRNVVSYILAEFMENEQQDLSNPETKFLSNIRNYINKNGIDSPKIILCKTILEEKTLDKIIPYLIEVTPILDKKEITEKEYEELKPVELIYKHKGISFKYRKGE